MERNLEDDDDTDGIDDTAEEEELENVDLVAVVCERFSVPTRLSFAGSRSTLSLKTLARSAFARILNSSSSSSSVCIVSPLLNTTVTSVCVRPQCRRARSSAAPYLLLSLCLFVCALFRTSGDHHTYECIRSGLTSSLFSRSTSTCSMRRSNIESEHILMVTGTRRPITRTTSDSARGSLLSCQIPAQLRIMSCTCWCSNIQVFCNI